MEKQQNHFSPFFSLLATTVDANRLVEKIDAFLENIYRLERKNIAPLIDETFDNEIGELMKEHLLALGIELTHHEEVHQALSKLEEAIRTMRILSLNIAIPLPVHSTNKIAEWVKKEFGDDVLIETMVNPELVGGAIIIFEGKYTDLSLHKKLDILFEAKKEEILKILQMGI